LRFGLLPAEDATTMVRDFSGIAEHVGKAVGLPVAVQVSQSYNALIEAMRAGHLEVAYVGGSQYVVAREQGIDVVPLVVAVDDTGRTYYKASIIVPADSEIKKLADLKDRTFAFVTPTSTSGGIAPRYFLVKNGLNPEKDFKRVVYAGKHDSVLLAVTNKKVDAGAVGDVYFPRWLERGLIKYSEYVEAQDLLKDGSIRVLGSQRVLSTAMIARGSLGEPFIEKVRAGFQSVPRETLGKYRIWGPLVGFKAVSDKDFAELAEMEKLLKEMKK
jgi:phosphonate transport system substrate-binding protein